MVQVRARSATGAALLRNGRRTQMLIAGILVLLTLWSISFAKVIILPIVLGLLFALTLSPVVRTLGRYRIPAPVSAIVIVLMIGLLTSYGIYMLRVPAQMLIQEAPSIQQELRIKLWTVLNQVERLREASEQMQALTGGDQADAAGNTTVVLRDTNPLEMAVTSLAGISSSLVIALLEAMFLLASGDMFRRRLVESMPDFSSKRRAFRISRDVERQISRYLAAITVINAGLGLCVGLSLHLLGMPYAPLWGVAAFLLNFLPYLGGMLGTLAAGAVALVTFDSFGQAILVPAAYLALTSIEGQMVTPVLVGRHLRLNAVSVFVAVVFWAWLWGVTGALLAVPFLVFVKVFCDNVPALSVIGRFLEAETGAKGRRRPRAGARRRKRAASAAPAEAPPGFSPAGGEGTGMRQPSSPMSGQSTSGHGALPGAAPAKSAP